MPRAGEKLGRYVLLKRLAVGGMGEVYLAAAPGPDRFGRYAALKILRDELACDQQFVDMLIDEANISMFLDHQNVVQVLDLTEDNNEYYLAMEYVQGLTLERLADLYRTKGRLLDTGLVLWVTSQMCDALHYAHTRVDRTGKALNIVHRDVTPANILLGIQGEVKLTDFGIARAQGRIHQTQAGVLKGKFGYMAPEAIRYEAIDGRTDLFCLGVVLYLLLTGEHPVKGAAIMEAIRRFEERRIAPPSTLNPQIPAPLDQIVMRALEPQPANRWASATQMNAALRELMRARRDWADLLVNGRAHLVQAMRWGAPGVFEPPMDAAALQQLYQQAMTAPPSSASERQLVSRSRHTPDLPRLAGPDSEEVTESRSVSVLSGGADPTMLDEGELSPHAADSDADYSDDDTRVEPPAREDSGPLLSDDGEATMVAVAPVRGTSPTSPSSPGRQLPPPRTETDEVHRVAPLLVDELEDADVSQVTVMPTQPTETELRGRSTIEDKAPTPPDVQAEDEASTERPGAMQPPPPRVASVAGSSSMPTSRMLRVAFVVMVVVALVIIAGATVVFRTELLWPTLQVSSKPKQATVWLDGRERGTTPLSLRIEPNRRHVIELTKPGYTNLQRNLQPQAFLSSTTLGEDLQKKRYLLRLPTRSTIRRDGQVVARSVRELVYWVAPDEALNFVISSQGYEDAQVSYAPGEKIPDIRRVRMVPKPTPAPAPAPRRHRRRSRR